MKFVERAIKNGSLNRPNQCEICGKIVVSNNGVHPIVAHHWKGYDFPLEIWWACRSCNGILDIHDGSLAIETAKVYVRKRQYAKLGYVLADDDPRLATCNLMIFKFG